MLWFIIRLFYVLLREQGRIQGLELGGGTQVERRRGIAGAESIWGLGVKGVSPPY